MKQGEHDMTKRFVFDTPEQLKDIGGLVKEGNILNVVRIWRVAKMKSATTAWDGKIGISFYTEGRERCASVFRLSVGGELKEMAKLKYAPALNWCREHLRAID